MTQTTKITGPIHPLTRLIRDGQSAQRAGAGQYLDTARELIAHHNRHGISDQTIYGINGPGKWTHMGSYEDRRELLTHGRDYVAVSARSKPRDIAASIAPDTTPPGYHRAVQLRAAASTAIPMVAATLAVCAQIGAVEWDTGEAVYVAAERIALDAAWALVRQPNPVLPRPADLYAAVLDSLGLTDRPAADYARHYLDARDAIAEHLRQAGIEWGAPLLDARQAAERAKLAWPSWRSALSRQDAPVADDGGRWLPHTVDAWRLARGRAAMDW